MITEELHNGGEEQRKLATGGKKKVGERSRRRFVRDPLDGLDVASSQALIALVVPERARPP